MPDEALTGRKHLDTSLEHPSKRQHDDKITRAVAPEQPTSAKWSYGEVRPDIGEMIDCLHRGIGIVDRRGQRFAANVDLLSNAECDILFDGSFKADADVGYHRRLKGLCSRPWDIG